MKPWMGLRDLFLPLFDVPSPFSRGFKWRFLPWGFRFLELLLLHYPLFLGLRQFGKA